MTNPSRKVCFVTIGATAPFDALLSNVLDQPFLEALQKHEYTTLLIQYGKEGQTIFDAFTKNNPPGSSGRYDLDIQGFGFKSEGLVQEMRSTKANLSQKVDEGMILSHAGKPPCHPPKPLISC
jgi:beta-1,4-N-acetylglucosaminyltransferase